MKNAPGKPAVPASTTPFLLVSLFVTGACSLVLEILGTRLISPLYGSSLYTWSALITTTMVALAAGYAWGGRLGDRDPRLALFARLLLAAGLTVGVIPVLREPVLRASAPLGLKLGALAAAAALVGPSLVVIGMMGPIVTRLTATSAAEAGRRAGDAWAVSTVGSVAGAGLAGFVLIPLLPGSRILFGAAALLVVLGAWGSWLAARRPPALQLAAGAALLVVSLRPAGAPHGAVLRRVESPYGRIELLDGGERLYLLVNGTNQSAMEKSTGMSPTPYIRAMQWVRALRPRAGTALVLGLGGGLLPKALERAGLTADSVEIDPEVVEAARGYFGYSPRGRTFIEDARAVLESRRERWDLMALDAFGSESPPCHLFTVEAFARMRESLTPGGVLAVNLVSGIEGPEGRPWRATYKTLARVFPNVRVFGLQSSPDLFNVLFFASSGSLEAPASAAPKDARAAVAEMLALELTPTPADAALMSAVPEMTDDFAPLDSLLAAAAVRSRRRLQEDMAEILLR